MNDLIKTHGLSERKGEPVVSSRKVAEIFGKEHKNVLRDIEDYISSVYENILDLDGNLKKLDEIREKYSIGKLMYFDLMLTEYTMFLYKQACPREKDVHTWFKREGWKKLDGYKPVRKKSDSGNIPDAWLEHNGDFVPVEMKLNSFDNSALSQLNRYVDFYGASEGVAVADNLTCELPNNITFVKYDIDGVLDVC